MRNRPVKILQVGMTNNIGGMETYLMQQFRHLDRQKVIYDFVNNNAETSIVFTDEIRKSGSQIYNIISRRTNPIKHYYQWLRLLWDKRYDYDGVVLNGLGLTYVFPLFAAKLVGIPIRIMHSHNSNYEVNLNCVRKFVIGINRILLNYSVTDRFACSKMAGDWMFPGKKFHVIHNAIDASKFSYDLSKRQQTRASLHLDGKFIVGNVARFSYQKNHEFLIDVFYELQKKVDNAVLLLAGGISGGDNSYLLRAKSQVEKLGIQDKVFFLGMYENMQDLYQAMDVFVLPSRFEGLCVAAVEAQASGLMCVSSDALSKETCLVPDRFFQLSLKESNVQWAEFINGHRFYNRRNEEESMKRVGYDISTEVDRVENYYLSMIGDV